MANITVPGLPAKTGTILDAAYLHLNESSVDKKVTIVQLLAKIEAQYSADIVTFLGSANKAEGRANLSIDRRVTVDDANYTILATDKVVAQIGTMSAARTFSLPAASSFTGGAELIIVDESGSVTETNTIVIQRNGTDTIDGDTSVIINQSYGIVRLISNGSNSWKLSSKEYNLNVKALNGYSFLSSDMLLQWGIVNFTNSQLVTLPYSFPNSILNAQATTNGNFSGENQVFLNSVSQITLYNSSGFARDVFYTAIGC